VRTVLVVSSAVSLTSGSFLVVEPLYAHLVLHRPPSQFALFEAAAGVGGVLTGLLIPKLGSRLTGRRILPLAAVGYGLAAAAFIGTTSVPVAYTGALCWGVAAAVFSAVGLTALQRLSPAHSHGRVMALRSALNSGADTAGLPLAAIIIGALGVRSGALALAAVAVVAGLCTLRKGLPPCEPA
jgi:MFS family permease